MISINLYEIIMQIGNFLLLVYLLKRFLFKPIVTVLDQRTQTIQTSLDETKSNHEKSAALLAEKEQALKEAHLEARDVRKRVEEAGKKEQEQIRSKAKEEAQHILDDAKQTLTQDVERAKKKLTVFAGDLSVKITKKVVQSDEINHNNVINSYMGTVKA